MVTVLLMRPRGQNESLAARLRPLADVVECPVLEIAPTELGHAEKRTVQNLDRYDHIIFLSQNAVRFGMPQIDAIWPQLPERLGWFAIGDATARALAEFGVDAVVPTVSTSEGLLDLAELMDLKDQQVLIVRGARGREVLARELIARGAGVDQIDVYERVAASLDDRARARLAALSEPIAVIYSVDTLAAFNALVAGSTAHIRLIVPSGRVAEAARQAGFAEVHVAAGAGEHEMCAAVEALV